MAKKHADFSGTDYITYREIMDELLSPIRPNGLDSDTLKRLYVSKSVYLENLRLKCFWELNRNKDTYFTWEDYEIISLAKKQTRTHLRELIIYSMNENLARRKVS